MFSSGILLSLVEVVLMFPSLEFLTVHEDQVISRLGQYLCFFELNSVIDICELMVSYVPILRLFGTII